MSAAQLSERTRALIISQIQANIADQLAAIRADRDDPSVATPIPQSYLIFDQAHTYQCPAIFVVVDKFKMRNDQGPNHVNADVSVNVTAVIESTAENFLTIQCERYQAALFEILQWTEITDTENNLKLFIMVNECQYSPIYTRKPTAGVMGNFRKEMNLQLTVKHWENPTS